MADPSSRIAAGLLGLVALWIGVYWWWPSSSQPRGISFSQAGAAGEEAGERAGERAGARAGERAGAGDVSKVGEEAGSGTKVTVPSIVSDRRGTGVLGTAGRAAEGDKAGDAGDAGDAGGAGVVNPPARAVIAPEFISHTLARGETYATLSLRYYGTGAHATAIAKANPLMSPTSLRPGRVVRVPKDPKNIQGLPLRDTAVGAGLVTEYVVESGDTLSRIAAKLYGDSSLSELIFEANKGVLPDEDSLRVGQKLSIPSKVP